MKIVTKIMAIFMVSSIVMTQGLFDQYDIPVYEYSTLQVSGDDLFNMTSQGDNSTTTINLGTNYMSVSQSPGFNLSYGVNFDYNSESSSDGDDNDDDYYDYYDDYDDDSSSDDGTSSWEMTVPFSAEKYFTGTKGAFGFADGTFSTSGGDTYAAGHNEDDSSDLHLTIGGGFGRVVSAKPVAQAVAIADAIDGDDSDATLLAIASVIGKGMDFYTQEYKDDAEQQYYNDLAEAAGDPGAAMAIRKVLESPAYNISDRYTGWSVKAGITNNYMQCDGCEDKGYMVVQAEYAMPMDVNAQLRATLSMYTDLNSLDDGGDDYYDYGDYYDDYDYDDGPTEEDIEEFGAELGLSDETIAGLMADILGVGGGSATDGWTSAGPESTQMDLMVTYTLDHSYNWSTNAYFNYEAKTPGGSDANTSTTTTLGVSTTKSVLNKMTMTGMFGYTMTDDGSGGDQADPTMEIATKITYWVF